VHSEGACTPRFGELRRRRKHYETLEDSGAPVDDFDVVLVRQDPPFDMGYVTNTYLLELTKTLVINPPRGIRNISEKMSILQFPELTPKTWVGRDIDALEAFAKRFDQVVLKDPLHDGRRRRDQARGERSGLSPEGERVHRRDGARADPGAGISAGRVTGGDKRVFVLNGEPFAALKRIAESGRLPREPSPLAVRPRCR
jgi:glutathione synthase